jgi:hypothetical protein
VDPPAAVGLAGDGMDLADDVGQRGVTDPPRRRWPAAPGVEAPTGRPPAPGNRPGRAALEWSHLDGREPSNGGACSFSSSVARRVVASSVSRCPIRRRAATSSWCSWLLRPGNRPGSMRSWRRQGSIDWALVPQRLGDLSDRPSGRNQVQDLATELRWVAASSHAGRLALASMRNPTTHLHQTRGRPRPRCGPAHARPHRRWLPCICSSSPCVGARLGMLEPILDDDHQALMPRARLNPPAVDRDLLESQESG